MVMVMVMVMVILEKVQFIMLIEVIIREYFFFNLEGMFSQILDPTKAKVAAP